MATPTRRASEETGGVTRWPQPASLAGASGWYGRSSLSRYRCDRSKPIDPWVTFEPPVALRLRQRSHAVGLLLDRRALDITPAAKKVIYQPEARARDPVRFPRWRVGLICSSMRNFLAGVILLAIVLLVATAFEGLICIIMMLPLAVPIVVLGTLVGYFILELGPEPPRDLGKLVIVLFALLPTMVGAEHVAKPEPVLFTCETSVVVDASPENVWRHVVSFSDLDPPNDWLFRTGVAYPIRARIEGTGVGAVRRCEFSTGAFVEPIEVWDEPRLLRFAVTSNPAPMQEWNPLFEIHPPHLDGFLVSKQGQFLLTPLPGGKTLLKGSTLYQHGLWPASYWRLWSDPIIHRIHDRVLRHIKTLAESEKSPVPGASATC